MSDITEIEELYGLGNDIGTIRNNRLDPFQTSRKQRPDGTVVIPELPSFTAAGWQREIEKAFVMGHSMIISASPAAGKTQPLIDGFYNILKDKLMKKLSKQDRHHPSFPRLLFVTPRSQLAGQMYNDFVNNLLLKLVTASVGAKGGKFSQSQQNIILDIMRTSYIALSAGSHNDDIRSDEYKYKPIVIATYEKSAKILESSAGRYYNRIIVDELQEYLPNPGKPIHVQDSSLIDSLVTITDHGMQKRNTIIYATGSVNKSVLIRFKDHLESSYHKKVLIRGTDIQTNRSKLTLIPFSRMRNSLELADLIKQFVSNGMTNNVIITFAKKEKPLNHISIISTAMEVVKTLPVTDVRLLQTAVTKTRTSKEFVDYQKQNPMSKSDISNLLYFNLEKIMAKESDRDNIPAPMDEHNLLFQCVIRGVGFIVGGQEEVHKRIVQSLFMAGKLHTLIASDAVGVGANVLAKRLFIPDLVKFEDGVFGPVNASNLIQLVNRAGRNPGLIPYAAVYVQPKDLEYAMDVLNKTPDVAAGDIDIDVVLSQIKGVGDKATAKDKIKNLFSQMFLGGTRK